MNRSCLLCGKEFKINSSQQKFCCENHKDEFRKIRKRKDSKGYKKREFNLICSKCGKEFIAKTPNRKDCDYCRGRKKCEYCGKEFQDKNKRRKTCSVECDKALRKKRTIETSLEKYGFESPNKSDKVIEKIRQTNKERYGGHPSRNKDIMKNRRETCLQKYGVENTLQVREIRNKITETRRKKYGEHMELITKKSEETCMKRYGFKYGILSPNNISISSISKENIRISKLLEQNNINISFEKRLRNYSYDLYIQPNILIEIDPWYTHNSTKPHTIKGRTKDPKDKYYHYNKTKLALENKYICIHKFDWNTDKETLELIKNISNYNFRQGQPRLHWYNPKTKKHLRDFNESYNKQEMTDLGYVEIYDDGIIY